MPLRNSKKTTDELTATVTAVVAAAVSAQNDSRASERDSIAIALLQQKFDQFSKGNEESLRRIETTFARFSEEVNSRFASHELKFNDQAKLIYMGVGGFGLLGVVIPLIIKLVWK